MNDKHKCATCDEMTSVSRRRCWRCATNPDLKKKPCVRCKDHIAMNGDLCYKCLRVKDPSKPKQERPGRIVEGICSRCERQRMLDMFGTCRACRVATKRGSAIFGSDEYKANRPDQRRENNHCWRGGKHTDKQGYVWIRVELDDSIGQSMLNPKSTRKYVQEHRMVVAKWLGRPLGKKEVVHHINGNRADNRLENLKLFSSDSEHKKFIHLEQCPNCGYYLRQ